jgi:hypothetical protein
LLKKGIVMSIITAMYSCRGMQSGAWNLLCAHLV